MAGPVPGRQDCVLAGQSPVTLVGLFFGRDMPGGGQVSDRDWGDFAAAILTPAFPDGFTVYDGNGQWRDPATGHLGREPTKIVQIAMPAATPGLGGKLTAVSAAYRTQFHQQAVGVLTTQGCAAF